MTKILKDIERRFTQPFAYWAVNHEPEIKSYKINYSFIEQTKDGEKPLCIVAESENGKNRNYRLDYKLEFEQSNLILSLTDPSDDSTNRYYLSLLNGDREMILKDVETGKLLKLKREDK
uniref:hypothetical protein n=1 Tax=Fulvivirga sp. TaxID=1931237 RepID=UPI0040497926